MTDYFGKSPKMWVNEICVKQLVQPIWDVREFVPTQVPPKFVCICKIAYKDKVLSVDATGRTKKEAEQMAAREMLFRDDLLGMTPANLFNLSAKKLKSLADAVNGEEEIAGPADDPVSDTDDVAMIETGDSIGQVQAICIAYEFSEPEYDVVRTEGPPHKRVFTMSCNIASKDLLQTGRRHKKQVAKKLAAFRVLRELDRQGFTYESITTMLGLPSPPERGGTTTAAPKAGPTDSSSSTVNLNLEDITCHFSKFTVAAHRELLFDHGGRLYCNDESEKCLELFANYNHAFNHLEKSETLDKVLADQTEDLQEFASSHGGPLNAVRKIASELKVRISFVDAGQLTGGGKGVYMNLKYPFHFKYSIPNTSVVFGKGETIELAKSSAAENALQVLRLCFRP